jgi:hypothetical protein
MTPHAPVLVSSFGVAKTSTYPLGTSAITLVTDTAELARTHPSQHLLKKKDTPHLRASQLIRIKNLRVFDARIYAPSDLPLNFRLSSMLKQRGIALAIMKEFILRAPPIIPLVSSAQTTARMVFPYCLGFLLHQRTSHMEGVHRPVGN